MAERRKNAGRKLTTAQWQNVAFVLLVLAPIGLYLALTAALGWLALLMFILVAIGMLITVRHGG